MATLIAERKFNIDNYKLNFFKKNFDRYTFGPTTKDGYDAFDDQYDLVAYDASGQPVVLHAFGNNLAVRHNGTLKAGTIGALLIEHWGPGPLTQLDFTDIAISAKKFQAAINSKGSADDRAIFASQLGGDDLIHGSMYRDVVRGYGGDDVISGGSGNDRLFGGTGNDVIWGSTGNNLVVGGGGNDQMGISAPDNRHFVTLTSNDIYRGNKGNDDFWLSAGRDVYNGGTGTDTVRVATDWFDTNIDIGAKGWVDTGWHGRDKFISIENVVGNDKADVIKGSKDANVLHGMGGGDDLQGRGGDDQLFGGDGNDTLKGGNGNDRLEGGDGNDILWLDKGDDIIDGGSGIDTLMYAGDTAIIAYLGLPDAPQITGFGRDTLIGIENVTGGSGGEVLFGSDADNVFEGRDGNDELHGEDGNDTLNGGSGEDELYGGAGDDTLRGGAGDDSLSGNSGNDALYGDDGADTFTFEMPTVGDRFYNNNTIMDFNDVDGDKIELTSTSPLVFTDDTSEPGFIKIVEDFDTLVYVDLDGDAVMDVQIRVMDTPSLAESDFLLT